MIFCASNNAAQIRFKTWMYAGSPQRLLYPQVEINSNPNTQVRTKTITEEKHLFTTRYLVNSKTIGGFSQWKRTTNFFELRTV
jgi:hypothetical protein